jgi:imidazolonepropionase-like amidohydrolase
MIPVKTGYRVGWLIDGSGDPAVENRIVCVVDGRIQQIIENHQPVDPQMEIVDMSDCTVFPALVDSHVHLVMSGTTELTRRKKQLRSGYDERKHIIAKHVRQHFDCGVLAVRDGGDSKGDTLRYKIETADASGRGVTIASAGRGRNAPGRYGKLIAVPVKENETLTQSAFGATSERDHLKLVNSGLNSLTQFGVETPPQFGQEDLTQVVSTAKKYGQPIMIHANGTIPVELAIQAGCDSIEHGFFMGEENMRRMAENGVTWVPTAITMKAYINYLQNQGRRCDPSFADVSKKNLNHQLLQMSTARQLGVTLALGTDSGSPGVHHGTSVKEELELFIQAGFSVEGAIRCASRNGALLMGLSDRGKIAPGMRADMMAVRASVEKVPDALHQIVGRVVDGRYSTHS